MLATIRPSPWQLFSCWMTVIPSLWPCFMPNDYLPLSSAPLQFNDSWPLSLASFCCQTSICLSFPWPLFCWQMTISPSFPPSATFIAEWLLASLLFPLLCCQTTVGPSQVSFSCQMTISPTFLDLFFCWITVSPSPPWLLLLLLNDCQPLSTLASF